jgi:hypothetical protein
MLHSQEASVMKPRTIRPLLLGLVLATSLLPSLAVAKKRVVVLPFTGPVAGTARQGVAAALGRKATQVSPAAFASAAQQLGANLETAEGIVSTCSKVRCDAVVKGTVKKNKRRYTLAVTVYNGGTGEALGRRAATVRGPRRIGAAGAAIGGQCAALVAQGKFVKAKAKPKPPPKPEPPVVARKTDDVPIYKPEPEPEEKPHKRKKRKGDEDEEEEGVTKRAAGRYPGLFNVSFAVGLLMRSCTVSGSDAAKDSLYEGGIFPEFTMHADLYPLAFFLKNFARNIGLGLGYTRHMSISTAPQADPNATVDTTSQELLLDLRVRWAFWDKPTSPVVRGFFGWGLRDFNLGANSVLASMNYRFLYVGLEGTVPLWTQYVALHAGFDVRPLLGVGNDVLRVLGNKTGGLGYAFRGGVSGQVIFGIYYFLDVEYLRFGADFEGVTPPQQDPRDRFEATSSVDRFIRFWGGVGYAM